MNRSLLALILAISPVLSVQAEIRNPMLPSATWDALKEDVFGDAQLLDGTHLLSIDAPYRAHDAATVPVTLVETAEAASVDFVRLTLVVDENPAPVVAEFTFGDLMGEIDLESRVRVDMYSNVRAIGETADGEFYMVGRFVKASGGCSAPAMKDMANALDGLGKMKLRMFEHASVDKPLQSGMRREAQVMMRHPNYSGLQMNQLTQLFIPPHFVDEMSVYQGEELLFTMEGGISISEDPSFRFKYLENGVGSLTVKAGDTESNVFEQTFSTLPGA